MPRVEPTPQVVKSFLSRWLSKPDSLPDEFKSWIANYIAQNPNILFDPTQIPTLDVSKIKGVVPIAQIPTIPGSKLAENLGTSPPGSPVDGDIWIYNGSGFYWMFVYDSTETTYKWKFVGGAGDYAETVEAAGNFSATYVDFPTAGPTITVPRAGDYDVEIGAHIEDATNGTTVWVSYKIGAAATSDNDAIRMVQNASGNFIGGDLQRVRRKTALSASTALKMQFRVTGASTNQNIPSRWMRVTPVRVI